MVTATRIDGRRVAADIKEQLAARVAALRAAFHAAMADPAFLADAKKQRLEVKEVSGAKVAQLLTNAYAMPPDVVKAANEAMGGTGGAGGGG